MGLQVLMYAQLRDNSQGINKVAVGAFIKREPTRTDISITHETKLSALVHGGNNAGILAYARAMELAIQKASAHGMSIVGTNNSPTGTAALGYYARHVASQGLIALCFSTNPEWVAPHGSMQAIFGTNPIAIGIPRGLNGRPLVLDMATAAYSYGALNKHKVAGTSIPPGVALDPQGRATLDPSEALKGAIKVMGDSHKGSHLALMVEVLGGALVGAAVEGKHQAKNWGNMMLAIDPQLLGPSEDFEERLHIVLNRVKGAKKAEGVEGEILLPSERGDRLAAQREAANEIEVERNLLAALETRAAEGWRPS
mmetsp:Transcript_25253/g.30576  ORF Transcript_25253/g.30576 Transcript_25253/m.30576 type:complete len:311 (-) Transcript_25253:220-1152(-)